MFFRNAKPFNAVPALTDDFGLDGKDCFEAGLVLVESVERAGDDVKGVEKGWAAEVDVAAGGDSG